MKTKKVFLNDKKYFSILNKLMQLTLLLGGFLALPSCASGEYKIWKEEVKLNDGQVIVVTQKKRCSGAYTGGNYASCIAREAWLTIRLPEFGDQEILWHEHLSPRVLNVYEGRLYVVGFPPTGREFDLYGQQRPPYFGFLWEGGQWKRIPFGDIPLAIYDTNMLIDAFPPNGIDYLSLSQKENSVMNGNPSIRLHHKRIDPKYKSNF